MTPVGFDHVKLQIPADGLSDARRFYEEVLTLPLEGVDRYRSGEKPFVSARISPSSVIHIEPTAEFEMPQQTHYDHLAVRFEESIETIQTHLHNHSIPIDRELTPLGATGVAPAVYVTDPFGYRVEIKATANTGSSESF